MAFSLGKKKEKSGKEKPTARRLSKGKMNALKCLGLSRSFLKKFENTDPVKTPNKTSVNTPDKTSDKTPVNAPDKTSDKTPVNAPVNAPGKTPDKTPVNAPDKTSDKTPDKTPVNVPGKTSDKTPDKTPVNRTVNKGKAPPMIDIYAGSNVDQQSQAHSQMSEKGQTTQSRKENPTVRKLSKSKINAPSFLRRSFKKKGEKIDPVKSSDKTVNKGKAPPMIDIHPGSNVDQQSQAHSQMSEKAQTTQSRKEKPVVRKLSKSKINALSFLGRSFKKKGEKTDPDKSVNKGKAPSMIDIYAGSNVDQQSQAHSQMSEKAKTTLLSPKATNQEDWKLLHELACQFDKFKLQEAEEMKKQKPEKAPQTKQTPGDDKDTKKSLEAIFGGANFRADGSFLDNKFIDQYLVEAPKFSSVTFDFSGQGKLYKRFNRKNDEQKTICKKFAAALLQHPKSSKITQLNLSNALLPDAFLEALSDQCIASGGKGLPMLQVLNLESNVLGKPGIDALCRCIADAKVWPRLQVLKLENQNKPLATTAEEALGEVVVQNTSLVVVGYRIRTGIPKQQIENTVKFNLDKLRQARRMHASEAGTLKARKRNEMELYFDKIASNADRSVVNVDLTGNLKFLGLNATERTKTGAAFATNKTVKTVKMVKLKLDDAFAEAFGSALATNTTLETVILDSNSFSGTGMMALLSGLGKNTTITNFQVRHQSKIMSSSDEEKLPDLLKDNTTVLKLGIDARNPLIKKQLELKANQNSELQRKLRAAAKKKTKK